MSYRRRLIPDHVTHFRKSNHRWATRLALGIAVAGLAICVGYLLRPRNRPPLPNVEVVVAVDSLGQYDSDGKVVTLDSLERQLRAVQASGRPVRLVIRADRQVVFAPVAELLSLCSRVGVESKLEAH